MLWNQHYGFKMVLPRGGGKAITDTLDMYLQAWSGAIVEHYKKALQEYKAQIRLECLEHQQPQAYTFRIVDQADNIYATAYLPRLHLMGGNMFKLHSVLKEVFTINFKEKTPNGAELEYDLVFERQSH